MSSNLHVQSKQNQANAANVRGEESLAAAQDSDSVDLSDETITRSAALQGVYDELVASISSMFRHQSKNRYASTLSDILVTKEAGSIIFQYATSLHLTKEQREAYLLKWTRGYRNELINKLSIEGKQQRIGAPLLDGLNKEGVKTQAKLSQFESDVLAHLAKQNIRLLDRNFYVFQLDNELKITVNLVVDAGSNKLKELYSWREDLESKYGYDVRFTVLSKLEKIVLEVNEVLARLSDEGLNPRSRLDISVLNEGNNPILRGLDDHRERRCCSIDLQSGFKAEDMHWATTFHDNEGAHCDYIVTYFPAVDFCTDLVSSDTSLCYGVNYIMDSAGEVTAHEMCKALTTRQRMLAFRDVDRLLDPEGPGDLDTETLKILARTAFAWRMKRLDEGSPIDLSRTQAGSIIVQEHMHMSSHFFAKELLAQGLALICRGRNERILECLTALHNELPDLTLTDLNDKAQLGKILLFLQKVGRMDLYREVVNVCICGPDFSVVENEDNIPIIVTARLKSVRLDGIYNHQQAAHYKGDRPRPVSVRKMRSACKELNERYRRKRRADFHRFERTAMRVSSDLLNKKVIGVVRDNNAGAIYVNAPELNISGIVPRHEVIENGLDALQRGASLKLRWNGPDLGRNCHVFSVSDSEDPQDYVA